MTIAEAAVEQAAHIICILVAFNYPLVPVDDHKTKVFYKGMAELYGHKFLILSEKKKAAVYAEMYRMWCTRL